MTTIAMTMMIIIWLFNEWWAFTIVSKFEHTIIYGGGEDYTNTVNDDNDRVMGGGWERKQNIIPRIQLSPPKINEE